MSGRGGVGVPSADTGGSTVEKAEQGGAEALEKERVTADIS